MKDIRPELHERLTDAKAKEEKHLALADEAKAEVAGIQQMLEIENRRFGHAKKRPEAPWEGVFSTPRKRLGDSPLTVFLGSVLIDGKPHSLDELAVMATTKGFRAGEGKSLKRVLNATLLSLMHKERAAQTPEGNWVIAKKHEASSAETDEASR